METSFKTGFAQISFAAQKNLSCPKFGGAAAPQPPRPVRLCILDFLLADEGRPLIKALRQSSTQWLQHAQKATY